MCSRYETPEDKVIAKHYKIKVKLPKFKPMIYPGYQTPVVYEPEGKDRIAKSLFWGFVLNMPSKRDSSKIVSKILQNAVSETLEEKRTFKGAWMKGQRCILPAKTFLEPKDGEFVRIHDSKLEVLSIAGIWGDATYKEKKVKACTMLTCGPNAFMDKFHDRMPVILKPEDIDEWLSPDTPPDQAMNLCKPYKGKLSFV